MNSTHMHEFSYHFICDLCSSSLEFADKLLKTFNQHLFDFTCQHLSRWILFLNIRKLVIIFQEKAQPLVGHINFQVSSLFSLFLHSLATTTQSICINFLLNLFCSVCEENSAIRDTRWHFTLGTLEGREKGRVIASGLHIADFGGHFSSHAEIRVLVNSCGDQTMHVFAAAINMRESVRKSRHRLDRGVCELANGLGRFEAENTLDLTQINVLLGFYNVGEQVVNVVYIWENKSFFRIESKSDYIFDVVNTHLDSSIRTFELTVSSENVLFIVCDLDN
jgi:hypothetical protein